MKRKLGEVSPDSSSSEAPPKPLKVHKASGYIFEFENDVETIEGEIWKQIPQWYIKDTQISVSNKGRLKSCRGVITTPRPRKDGYSSVEVKGHTFRITHLILHAFNIKQRTNEHKYVNHKDLDPTNNCLENLEWCTAAENNMHSYRTNPNRKSNAAKQSKPVECYINGKWEKIASANEAARHFNLDHGSIRQACRKNWQPKGHTFRYGTPHELDKFENEEWRTIPNSKAEVSSLGRFKDTRGVVKTPSACTNGYVVVGLNGKLHRIHILIAQCFLPPPLPEQTQVDHKDGEPSNNRLENLRWVTPSENIKNSYANNKDRKSHAPQQSKKVRAAKDGQVQIFASTMEAGRRLGINHSTISHYCCQNAKIASQ